METQMTTQQSTLKGLFRHPSLLTLLLVVLVWVVAGLTLQGFGSYGHLRYILELASVIGIVAAGQTLVIIVGGIDLSVGSIAALGSVGSAMLLASYPMGMALPMVVAMGAICGAISGTLIAFFRLPAFVITLAMMTAARGYALIMSNGQPIMVGDNGQASQNFGTSFTFGIPQTALLMIAVFGLALIILNLTRFGRLVKAIGSNQEAVRLSGISVPFYVLSVYVISGALAAIAGILITARSGVGSPSVGVGNELSVIAAVVIGGASLMGGIGGVINTFLGVMILGII
ncbi:hypothetical protein COL154_014309, partial [Colletotrichum chrysophilum]